MKYKNRVDKVSHFSVFAFISFSMSLFRLICVFILGRVLLSDLSYSRGIVLVGVLVLMVLDYYDGWLFRKSILANVEYWKRRRRIIDSTIDRIVVAVGCICLAIVDVDFVIPLIIIIARELVISTYCAWRYFKKEIRYPKIIAKISSASIGLVVISYLIGNPVVSHISLSVLIVSSIASLIEYMKP